MWKEIVVIFELGILIFINDFLGIGVFICIFFVVRVRVRLLDRFEIWFIWILIVGLILYLVIDGLILVCFIFILILKFLNVFFKILIFFWIKFFFLDWFLGLFGVNKFIVGNL